MKSYRIHVKAIYDNTLIIEADDPEEAIEKAKSYYDGIEDGIQSEQLVNWQTEILSESNK
jgi:hypothetical protein